MQYYNSCDMYKCVRIWEIVAILRVRFIHLLTLKYIRAFGENMFHWKKVFPLLVLRMYAFYRVN